ncbi:hypothetical protein J2S00_002809 [Caldalkalibacillus uzonensis]|uniref:Class I SAM-dependent methyltransferase n=1 Tax=Caldalkalibacillus uzonensis TaxID=353224 RepID=A0ABU0CUC3_9BACI|nr:class I SAM-dependent methyltransferase [Caldalkalibacillus uzonensis]MDQ0340014.1 hypothetical protein [Caldalkalibacillus uzonensis]
MSLVEEVLREQQGKAGPFSDKDIGTTMLAPGYRVDLRNPQGRELDKFIKANQVSDWSILTWREVGKPYQVNMMSRDRKAWEKEHQQEMPLKTSWAYFNRHFHQWFVKDVPEELQKTRQEVKTYLSRFKVKQVVQALGDVMRLSLWNYVHRVEDAIWDPRGKRALFEGLDVQKPRILFLGAAEGYEAMQLYAMYPGGEVVLVDYDEFCKTDRFGQFPETYPFLGTNPATGSPKVWYKHEMNIEYLVEDIRNLPFGKEFDIVISVGLLEHFPDEYKPMVLEWHRQFLKPGGYALMTTPRDQVRSRLFYMIMADVMNHTYRELMTIRQMGLYVYEGGFNILRHGFIKAHNGIVAQPR